MLQPAHTKSKAAKSAIGPQVNVTRMKHTTAVLSKPKEKPTGSGKRQGIYVDEGNARVGSTRDDDSGNESDGGFFEE